MRTERIFLDRIIFEESDIKELGLKLIEPLGQYDVLELGNQKYVCLPLITKGKKEYQVLFSYFENHVEPDKARERGAL